mmetsp:Transcript_19057/g.44398  ORF Transcript_19057/g.44398 Transcript_19057/m.44398 type:complete len:128 (-) Transcript_19057:95-478(-)
MHPSETRSGIISPWSSAPVCFRQAFFNASRCDFEVRKSRDGVVTLVIASRSGTISGELWNLVRIVGCAERLARLRQASPDKCPESALKVWLRIRHYLAQVMEAVQYLQDANTVHGDLKPTPAFGPPS